MVRRPIPFWAALRPEIGISLIHKGIFAKCRLDGGADIGRRAHAT